MSRVVPLEPIALRQMTDRGERFELVDVRTPGEHDLAAIPGGRLLDDAYHDEILALDRNTVLVCYCHHGPRSYRAAAYFSDLGFVTVYNLSGGVDAWSVEVDPTVPRY